MPTSPFIDDSGPLWGFLRTDGSLGLPPSPSKQTQWDDGLIHKINNYLQPQADGLLSTQTRTDSLFQDVNGVLTRRQPGQTAWTDHDGILSRQTMPDVKDDDGGQISGSPMDISVTPDGYIFSASDPQQPLNTVPFAPDYDALEKQLFPDGNVQIGWRQEVQKALRGDDAREEQRQANLSAVVDQGVAQKQAEADIEAQQQAEYTQMAEDAATRSRAMHRASRALGGPQVGLGINARANLPKTRQKAQGLSDLIQRQVLGVGV